MDREQPHILFVDDEETNLFAFNATFRRYYSVHTAKSAREGITILQKEPIEVIITDQRMPEMTGVEFLESILPYFPEPLRIILTGFSDIAAIIQAINKGEVYRYLTKPWNKDELKISIDNALDTYQLKKQNKELIQQLQEANLYLEDKVKSRTQELEEAQSQISEKYVQLTENHQKLSERNQMIDLLLRELNHRVLNNIQIVSAIINRESEEVKNESLTNIITRIDTRIREIARIHQQLMYMNQKVAQTDLYGYFQEIVTILRHLYFSDSYKISIQIEVNGLHLEQEKAYFLGFIVHELVTNSFKYAFKTEVNPVLKIYLNKSTEHYTLQVEDNGSGLPSELLDQNGLKFALIHSLGLKIVNLISKFHQGNFEVYNKVGKGVIFESVLKFKEA